MKANKIPQLLALTILIISLLSTSAPVKAANTPVEVLTGVRLLNVEKVDLASNNYRLDFYLWFS